MEKKRHYKPVYFYNEISGKEEIFLVDLQKDVFEETLGNEYYAIYSTDNKKSIVYSDNGFLITGTEFEEYGNLNPDFNKVYAMYLTEHCNFNDINQKKSGALWYLEEINNWEYTNKHLREFVKENSKITRLCIKKYLDFLSM